MDSVYIAKLFNKRHSEIMRIIRKIEEEIADDIFHKNFIKEQYNHRGNFYDKVSFKNQGMEILFAKMRLTSEEVIMVSNMFNLKTLIVDSNRKEVEFLDKIEKQLTVFGINEFSRQHNVLGKRVDLYLPQIGIAIEYDENDHAGYSYEDQFGRQRLIEEELNCEFIRLTDVKDDDTNCALVLKELLRRGKIA